MKSIILINYGKPIDIAPFIPIYKENKQKGMAALRLEMENRIKELMIHVSDMDNYDFYENIREINDFAAMHKLGLSHSVYNKFKADKETIKTLDIFRKEKPDLFNELKEKTNHYFKILNKDSLQDYLLETKPIAAGKAISCILFFIITLPVHLYGLVFNYPVYKTLDAYIPTIIKDTQFRSSLKFGVGLVLFPIWYLLFAYLSSLYIDNNWYVLLFVFSLPVTGLFTLNNWMRFQSFVMDCRYRKLSKKNTLKFADLVNIRKEITDQLEKLN